MQVFYVNIGGGEPTVRRDFWELLDYATAHDVGVKFSTNGSRITAESAARLAASDYVDVQVSLDGATALVNDAVRGVGSYRHGDRAMERLAEAGMRSFKLSVVVTRDNVGQLDAFKAIADRYGAQLRLTRLRPSGRGADVWDELHPTAAQQRAALRLAARARREGADRRLVLPPRRLRRAAAGAEPVRRRPRGLPDRSDRRRLCVPVRDPRRLPAPATSRARAASRAVWRESSCSRTCAGRRPAARACRARTTTRAAAAAWRRSSSPACRSTGPTRSACSGTASRCSRTLPVRRPRPAADHSRRPPRRPTAPATRAHSPGRSLEVRRLMAGGWFEIDCGGAAAGEASSCRSRSTWRSGPAPSTA